MEFISRFVKGVIGIFIMTVLFGLLMLPIEISVLGIEPKEDIGIGIGIITSIIGGVIGWVFLSKAKWLTILAVFVVMCIITGFVMEEYPEGYSAESYTFTAEVDGVSFDVSNAYAEYAAGWLDISASDVHEGKGKMKTIMFHLNCSKPGSITLNSDNHEFGSGAAYALGTKESPTIFATNSSSTGRVTISAFDLNENKVSVTFEYRGIQNNPSSSRVVKVAGSFKDIPIK